jgi:hypothetical protein
MQCETVTLDGHHESVGLEPLLSGDDGWARVAHGTLPAPANSFRVELRSPFLGRIELATAALPQRATVIALIVRPDGVLEVVQHLLRFPGRQYPEPMPFVPYGQMLRELVLGQRLFESGELIERGALPDTGVLRELLFAKWTDPIIGCMAYYAWNDADRRGLPEAQGVAASNTGITAHNLMQYFAPLGDARLIGVLGGVPGATLDSMLTSGELPVLARSCRELARIAEERGMHDLEVVRWAARVAPESAWTLTWEPELR